MDMWPFLVGLLIPASSSDMGNLPLPLAEFLETAAEDCAAFEGGMLSLGDGAISRPDIDRDGSPDWAMDAHRFSCSTAASLYCGTGGCPVVFHADGNTLERLSKGWKIVDFGPLRVILLQVHGTVCGGIGVNRCVEAVTLDDDGFQSLRGIDD